MDSKCELLVYVYKKNTTSDFFYITIDFSDLFLNISSILSNFSKITVIWIIKYI